MPGTISKTLFTEVGYTLGTLISYLKQGEIGLPDIQRPFVWPNAKVRDLFDSMYRGYPIGYLLLWQNALADSHHVGTDEKPKAPKLLIVDGQQRLTSLYAVVRGVPVIRDDFSTEKIVISFNPFLEKFEVADATTKRDKALLPNISVLWAEETDLFEVVDSYLAGLKEVREVTAEEAKRIRSAIQRVQSLLNFPFTALELSGNATEEEVAEVFVRINSKGKPLNQADFILTLMSVFWDEGRTELETFARESMVPTPGRPTPFNHFLQPSPDQLLRVSVGLGFKRARLQHVYSILRGKDLETGEFTSERRDKQFEVLKTAQAKTLDLQHWHDFLKALIAAGFRSKQMISSDNAVIFAYILYLVGRTEYKIDEHILRKVIARWFFMSALTARFSGSPESRMEYDLARFRHIKDGNAFVQVLERICDEVLTNDYWSIRLPGDLATASPRSPALFAYFAALNLLDARVLFSKMKVSELIDPATKSKRSAIERHHLFPKKYLAGLGISELRTQNQNANLALVEWGDNADIEKKPPSAYVPDYEARFSRKELERMYFWHALPKGWQDLPYEDFLKARREMIASVIAQGYAALEASTNSAEREESRIDVAELVRKGEQTTIEFKATLRMNLHTKQPDSRMEQQVLKTVAGFMNGVGGVLVIGVADDGTPIGAEADGFPNDDKLRLHFDNLIKDKIGPQFALYIHPRFEEYEGAKVFTVECWPAAMPAYVKDGPSEKFYVRTGASTAELSPSQTVDYVKQRFAKK